MAPNCRLIKFYDMLSYQMSCARHVTHASNQPLGGVYWLASFPLHQPAVLQLQCIFKWLVFHCGSKIIVTHTHTHCVRVCVSSAVCLSLPLFRSFSLSQSLFFYCCLSPCFCVCVCVCVCVPFSVCVFLLLPVSPVLSLPSRSTLVDLRISFPLPLAFSLDLSVSIYLSIYLSV